jgi:hypothetical protein
MPYLFQDAKSGYVLSMHLSVWVINFFSALAGLFISVYLLVSHDDLTSGFIDPIELSNSLNQVNQLINIFSSSPMTMQYLPYSYPYQSYQLRGI